MKLPTLLKKTIVPATLVLGVLIILIIFIGMFVLLFGKRGPQEETPQRTYQPVESSIYTSQPPDPKFPPPAEEQREFYTTYTEKPIHYSIEWSVRNKDRNPIIGKHEFTVKLYNSLNKQVAFNADESAPFTIGCIAHDGPYHAASVERQPFNFEPYETKKITLLADVSCLYLGTADNKYFWRIY